jgi:hypothetical protein
MSASHKEIYLCIHGSENEHYSIETKLRELFEVKYYRQLKDGHVPLLREVKIVAEKWEVEKFVKDEQLTVYPNPYKIKRISDSQPSYFEKHRHIFLYKNSPQKMGEVLYGMLSVSRR